MVVTSKHLAVMAAVLVLGWTALQAASGGQEGYQAKRARITAEMKAAIQEKADAGEYRCCISPPCDMCYLGHWIWEDGVCRCDDMIAKGEYDKVCPQCGGDAGWNASEPSNTCSI